MSELAGVFVIWLALGMALFLHMFSEIYITGVMFLVMIWLMTGIIIAYILVEMLMDHINK